MDRKEKMNSLLEYTTKVSFPFMASEERKKRILNETKDKIDVELADLVDDKTVFESKKEIVWEEAKESACKEFSTLPNNLRLNSFYFQEVMHQYVEKMCKLL